MPNKPWLILENARSILARLGDEMENGGVDRYYVERLDEARVLLSSLQGQDAFVGSGGDE